MDTICNRQFIPQVAPKIDYKTRGSRSQAARIRTRPGPVRFRYGCGRRHDWIGNLHCSSGDGPSYRQRGLAARGLGRGWHADDCRSPVLRRALGHDAASGRNVRLSPRSILTIMGVPVWLDTILCNRDGNDCRGGSCLLRFSGVLWPLISEDKYLIAPIRLSSQYALSLSTAQLLAIAVIAFLTFSNTLDSGTAS